MLRFDWNKEPILTGINKIKLSLWKKLFSKSGTQKYFLSYLIYSSKLSLKVSMKAIKQLITAIYYFDFPLFSVESPWFLYDFPFHVTSSHFSEHISNIHIHFLSIHSTGTLMQFKPPLFSYLPGWSFTASQSPQIKVLNCTEHCSPSCNSLGRKGGPPFVKADVHLLPLFTTLHCFLLRITD